MEWVEATGKTVDEALEQALEQLGVDRDEADIEVLEEPKNGLFGRVRSEARVRVRVAPTKPRAKEERRRPTKARAEAGAEAKVTPADARPARAPRAKPAPDAKPASRAKTPVDRAVSPANSDGNAGESGDRFLLGLLHAFGLEGTVDHGEVAEGIVEYRIIGADLGVLIGPKAQTLIAIQELLRTIVHYETNGHSGRIMLDVAGYRQKRRAALEEFTRNVAAEVERTGERRALEPMTAADRKVIHDAVNSLAGVSSLSEGEDPNRRVILIPAGVAASS